ncbi:hypothetical protein ACFYPN_18430 [Streptomyces sp. NPDC005576]|uniref:hypothetical protein n=1 Tax=unclassified Streptomyces TaxID=2593676 RepID=UPI00340D1C41
MPFEDELSGELRRAGDSFELSDRAALLDGAIGIGRRGVRRRRVAAAAGGALALALVAVGGSVAIGQAGGSGGELASGTHAVSPRAGGGNSGGRAGDGVSGKEMVKTLTALLSGGKVSGGTGVGTDAGWAPLKIITAGRDGARTEVTRTGASASVVYDDGDGPVTVTASLYPTKWLVPGSGGNTTDHPCLSGADGAGDGPAGVDWAYDEVDPLALHNPDGTVAAQTDDGCPVGVSTSEPRGAGLTGNRFRLLRDGVTLDVRAYSGVLGSAAHARSAPPVDASQLTALARSDRWGTLVRHLLGDMSAHDRPSATPTPSPAPQLDYSSLMPTFLRLLPDDVTVVRQQHADGEEYAEVVVDDGEGESLVGINVQRDMRDVAGDLYGSAETLPDGTLLAVRQEPGEKGGAGVVQWTADSMRPDGMRVVAMAFNAAQQSAAATRSEPALSIDELKALVTSPEWLELQVK